MDGAAQSGLKGSWGDDVGMGEGMGPPAGFCSDPGKLRGAWPIFDFGETLSTGAITCPSDPAAITCTDASTWHSFFPGRDSYELP